MKRVLTARGRLTAYGCSLILFICCGMGRPAFAGSITGLFSEELDSPLYDCQLSLTPAADLRDNSAVHLTLETGELRAETRVAITTQSIVIESVKRGRTATCGSIASGVKRGAPYQLTLQRRGDLLGLLRNDNLIFRCQVPRPVGAKALVAADRGWRVDDARIQRLEPVAFSDDFMRTAENQNGDWTIQSGNWGLQSAWDKDPHGNGNRFNNIIYAQNPFSWLGKGQGICTTGKPFWEDYTFTTAIQPGTDGAVGVLVNMSDARNGLLVRWTPGNDASPTGNRLAIFRYLDGTRKLLAETPGGYIPGQWYRLSVISSLDGVHVQIDGQERLAAKNLLPWRGGIGLYTEGDNGTVFNNVTVYGRTLNVDLFREARQMRINQRFQDDKNGMQEWAAKGNEWENFTNLPNHYFARDDYFGEYWLTLSTHMNKFKTGELWLALHNDGKQATSGYRAVLARADGDNYTCTLYRDGRTLAQKSQVVLQADMDYSFRLRYTEKKLRLERDGEVLLEANDGNPPAGLRPAYCGYGCFADVRDIRVIGRNTLDYTFTEAPTDWTTQGTWMPSVRWACSPQWSFLGGWSRGDAALWHKTRITGDQSFKAFVGPKMEYPRERIIYDYHNHDFGVTICGDGHNPRTGYSAIYGAPGADGTPNQRTILLRNGVEVASTDTATVPSRGTSHRQWFDLCLRKRGNLVVFALAGKDLLTYQDPNPIVGGVPAVWTTDNGMMLARARIDFATPPQPRVEPTVVIDEPWYPEWANVGHPLVLDFPHRWSTSGQPVHLEVVPRNVPAGSDSALNTEKGRVTLTPRALGDYWYQIDATDGTTRSQAFHLAVPAYDPAQGRDDSHALVLYRFDEGKGAVVHDKSAAAPAADIVIPADAPVEWLPGRGLTLHGAVTMQTANGVKKLLEIAVRKACTLEVWISTDTLYPPSAWSGCLLTWEKAVDHQNFALLHQSSALTVDPCKASLYGATPGKPYSVGGYRTGLTHVVAAWDGTETVCYVNGVSIGKSKIAWNPTDWTADLPLILGSLSDGQRYFLGTYYLAAIHDTCFTEAQVTRHYHAGPDGK